MPIVLRLDVVMAQRKVCARTLARAIGVSEVTLSLLKAGKVKGLRLSTLEALCRHLDCQPADLLEHVSSAEREGVPIRRKSGSGG